MTINRKYIIDVKIFITKLVVSIILIGIGAVTTLGAGAYIWLKTDNDRLEAEQMELVLEKASLVRILEEKEAEQSKLIGQ